MHLLQLPVELQLHILSYLGPGFFRSSIPRLTVSKSWYYVAWRILVSHVYLTPSSLSTFMEADVSRESKDYIKSVSISLHGFQTPSSAAQQADDEDTDAIRAWTAQLNASLEDLALLLREARALRHLKLKAEPRPWELLPWQEGYLMVKPLADILSLRHLTTLEVDTADAYPQSRPRDSGIHICRSICTLIPTLRRLRCRMDTICEHLLDPPADQKARFGLHEVIVNLSLSELSDSITAYRYPERCRPGLGTGFSQLKGAMEAQAVVLSRQLTRPQMVRVISHVLPSCEIHAFDAITERRMRLENNRLWDAEGEIVSEVDVDQEMDLFGSDELGEPVIIF